MLTDVIKVIKRKKSYRLVKHADETYAIYKRKKRRKNSRRQKKFPKSSVFHAKLNDQLSLLSAIKLWNKLIKTLDNGKTK